MMLTLFIRYIVVLYTYIVHMYNEHSSNAFLQGSHSGSLYRQCLLSANLYRQYSSYTVCTVYLIQSGNYLHVYSNWHTVHLWL